MVGWFVIINNATEGPFSEAEVADHIKSGKFQQGSLAWKKGIRTWEPVEAHFPDIFSKKTLVSSHPRMADQEHRDPSPSINPSIHYQISKHTEDSDIRGRITGGFKHPLLRRAILFIASLIAFLSVHYNSSLFANPSLFEWVWGGTLCATLISGVVLIHRSWVLSKEPDETIITNGIVKLLCVLGGACLIAFSLIFVPQRVMVYRVANARVAFDKYTMNLDVAGSSITIDGLIGPSFADQLKRNLQIHSGIHSIVITSPGGLVDQGLEAAKAIENYGNITVTAHRVCNSSCLLILMAGKTRLADWDMQLGFHATSAITNLDKSDYQTLTDLGNDADNYLVSHGVPVQIVEQANAKGPEKLENVSAIKLADSNVISGLRDDNGLVAIDAAKWRLVEDSIHNSPNETVNSVFPILRSIRENKPAIVNKYAAPMYDAYFDTNPSKESGGLRSIFGSMFSEVIPLAIQSADGKALYEYFSIDLKQLEYMANMEEWGTCAEHVNGNVIAGFNLKSKNVFEQELVALEKLIKSASDNDWDNQPIPKWAKARGLSLLQFAVGVLNKNGVNVSNYDKDAQTKCLATYATTKAILNAGVDDAPPIFRWFYFPDKQKQ